MKSWKLIVFGAFLVSLTLMTVAQPRTVAAQKGGYGAMEGVPDASDAYEVVPNWPQPLQGLDWSATCCVFAESPNRVYVFQRGLWPTSYTDRMTPDPAHPNWPHKGLHHPYPCKTPGFTFTCTPGGGEIVDEFTKKQIPGSRRAHLLNVFDAKGKLVESFEQWNDQWIKPHALLIDPNDPERHVWTGDEIGARVLKFTHDGKKLVMEVGVKNTGTHEGLDDQVHFGTVSGIGFGTNGEFYAVDSRGGRVVKFSKDGKVLMEIGKKGTGPGELRGPDSMDVDSQGRIYVVDGGGSASEARVQVFDKGGKYLKKITIYRPAGGEESSEETHPHTIALSKDERYLYVALGGPGKPSEIRTYSVDDGKFGKGVSSWRRPLGGQPGTIWGLHDFTVDTDGNLYVTETYGGRAWKYRPKPGANPKLLFRTLRKNTF